MKEIINNITNIQKYCSMIVQNHVDAKVDIHMNDINDETFKELAKYYDKEIQKSILDSSKYFVVSDENCNIFINLKK